MEYEKKMVVEEARLPSQRVAHVRSDDEGDWRWVLLGRWDGKTREVVDFGAETSWLAAWSSVEEAERRARAKKGVDVTVTSE